MDNLIHLRCRARGNQFFELTGSERQRFNRLHVTVDGGCCAVTEAERGGGGSVVRAEFSNSPAAGGDLQSVNLDSATEATTHDY